ncbi:MAG: BON domain-containing protein [Legionellaceae bacterium]|nr:BON domain-containing protein [Legionellaceae bacterium]
MKKLSRYFIFIALMSTLFLAQAADLKKIEQGISDTVITTKIKTKITQDKNLNPLKISVTTHDGIVTLRGHAKNKQAFVDTLRIATSTTGVKGVDTSHLDIKLVNSAFADAYITAKVEAAVLEAKVLDDESIPLVGINAKTMNGIVHISGQVKSGKSVALILKRVNHIHGVKKIISNLEVTLKSQDQS